MSGFLNRSKMTDRGAFIERMVKAIVVMPGDALLRDTIPIPDDRPYPAGTLRVWRYTARFCLPSRLVELGGLEPPAF